MKGYDLNLLRYFKDLTINNTAPIIINGGCGTPKDIQKAFLQGADACCASSIFNFTKYSYYDVKEFLFSKGINVRL